MRYGVLNFVNATVPGHEMGLPQSELFESCQLAEMQSSHDLGRRSSTMPHLAGDSRPGFMPRRSGRPWQSCDAATASIGRQAQRRATEQP